MVDSLSLRRLVENEVVFRQYNENIQHGLDNLTRIAKEDGQVDMLHTHDVPLHFYCECSDENCRERVLINADTYKNIHQNRSRFVMLSGHQVVSIEHVIRSEQNYCVVEKFVDPPEVAEKLHKTNIDNSN